MKHLFYLPIIILCVMFIACGNTDTTELDREYNIEKNADAVVNEFFEVYQKSYPDWYETKEGANQLAIAFRNKILSDTSFALACANNCGVLPLLNGNHIYRSETVSEYTTKTDEYGEIKAFEFHIPIKLVRPMFNGDTIIEAKYEIMTTIPATIPDHDKPYTEGKNYCDTIAWFLDYNYPCFDLGSYMLGVK